jgi:predicted transposase YbfD/YdcC
MGLAGVAQVARIRNHTQVVRQGKVIKETDEVRFAVTSYWSEEAGPDDLLGLARDHWSIENGQHHRRDRTQREDHCTVRDTFVARTLSLFRSLAIFVFKQQADSQRGKASLPAFQSYVYRHPGGLLRRLTQARHEQ